MTRAQRYVCNLGRKFILVGVLVLMTSMVFMAHSLAPYSEYNAVDSKEDDIVTLATNVLEKPENVALESVKLATNPISKEEMWVITWTDTGSDLIEATIDPNTQQLVGYVDTTRSQAKIFYPETTKSTAFREAKHFLDYLSSYNLFSWPANCHFDGLQELDSPWTFEWSHILNDMKVADNYIRIRLDADSYTVKSFRIKWNSDIDVSTIRVSLDDTINVVSDLVTESDTAIEYSGMKLVQNKATQVYDPSWIIDLKKETETIASLIISSNTGNIIRYKPTNSYGTVKMAQGRDSYGNLDPAHTAELEGAEFRLESNNYDVTEWDKLIYTDELATQWDTANIAIYSGHGDGGSGVGSWIDCYNGDFEGTDVPSDMSQADIIYTSSCHGGWITQYPQYYDRYLSNSALEAGAKAFFGFKGSVYTLKAKDYAYFFWAAAANGKSFATCQEYAGNYISNISLGASSALYDSRSHSLSKKDVGYNKIIGYLHVGEQIQYHNEPCWHIDSDQLRFYSYEYQQFFVTVNPENDEFDVVVKIYDKYYHHIKTLNSYGNGGTESGNFWGGYGWYYIKIYSASSSHGGVYDLDIITQS